MSVNYNTNHRNQPTTTSTGDVSPRLTRRGSRRFSIIIPDLNQIYQAENNQAPEAVKQKTVSNLENEKNGGDDSEKGCWGWIVVFGAFLSNMIVAGLSLSYGIMTESITKANGSSDKITITQFHLIGSSCIAATYLAGPLSSILTEKFGFRITTISGSIISAIGIILPYLVSPDEPDFPSFLIGFAIISGIGFGISYTLSVVIVGLYFDKNVALATGITVAGSGAGNLLFPFIINEVLKAYLWQGAIIFQAIMAAVSALVGIAYKPLSRTGPARDANEEDSMPLTQQFKELMRTPSYFLFSFSGLFIMIGYFAPFGFLKDSGKKYIGSDSAVLLVSIVGFFNAAGRVVFGLVADKLGHSIHIFNAVLTIGGISTILYPFATSHLALIACSVVFGCYAAVVATLRSVILKRIVGPKKFNVGFGISLVFMGIGTLFGNTLGGYLKDLTGDYDMTFYILGGFLLLAAGLSYPVPLLLKYEERKN